MSGDSKSEAVCSDSMLRSAALLHQSVFRRTVERGPFVFGVAQFFHSANLNLYIPFPLPPDPHHAATCSQYTLC